MTKTSPDNSRTAQAAPYHEDGAANVSVTSSIGIAAIAIDVGTTTLAASLVDLKTKKTLSSVSLPNPQKKWGADVLARIRVVTENPKLLADLKKSVIGAINELINSLLKDTPDVKRNDIIKLAAAGNSVMQHILLGVSPAPIGVSPYRPAFKEPRSTNAASLGLNVSATATLYTFPMLGGFVGGDSVSALIAINSNNDFNGAESILTIDIGTNSEIIICSKDDVYATSAAAGPAFEGGEISSGMTAQRGALRGLTINGDTVTLDVIGDVAPIGICGSGIIDVTSELLSTGIVDKTGRIKDPDEIDSNLSTRLTTGPEGNAFTLFKGASGELAITQADIRALQVAKAAIRAGINVILKKARVESKDIDKIFVAGAFGSNITEQGLLNIGLIDKSWKGRVTSIGDAALIGAEQVLKFDKCINNAASIAEKTHYIPLSGSKGFQDEFIKNMNFM